MVDGDRGVCDGGDNGDPSDDDDSGDPNDSDSDIVDGDGAVRDGGDNGDPSDGNDSGDSDNSGDPGDPGDCGDSGDLSDDYDRQWWDGCDGRSIVDGVHNTLHHPHLYCSSNISTPLKRETIHHCSPFDVDVRHVFSGNCRGFI